MGCFEPGQGSASPPLASGRELIPAEYRREGRSISRQFASGPRLSLLPPHQKAEALPPCEWGAPRGCGETARAGSHRTLQPPPLLQARRSQKSHCRHRLGLGPPSHGHPPSQHVVGRASLGACQSRGEGGKNQTKPNQILAGLTLSPPPKPPEVPTALPPTWSSLWGWHFRATPCPRSGHQAHLAYSIPGAILGRRWPCTSPGWAGTPTCWQSPPGPGCWFSWLGLRFSIPAR